MGKVHIMLWSKTACGLREYPGIRVVRVGKISRYKDACKRCRDRGLRVSKLMSVNTVKPEDAPEGMVDTLINQRCTATCHIYPNTAKSFSEMKNLKCVCGKETLASACGPERRKSGGKDE